MFKVFTSSQLSLTTRPRSFLGTVVGRHLAAAALAFMAGSAMAQAIPGNRVYVSSEKDNKIYVFDTQGQRVSAIDVCQRPRHMMFNADHSQIYVCCGDDNALGLVDTASGKMTGTLPLDDSPEIFDLSPDGKTVYVSIEDDSTMGAYDLQSKKKLFEVKVGGEPEGILVMPDGKHAYVTSEEANVVHYIDLSTRKIVKNIRVGARPRRFVLTPDGKQLWVSNELSADVSVVSTEDQKVKHTIKFKIKGIRANDITPVGMTLSAGSKSIWVGLGRANHVAELDVATREVRKIVLVGKRAWGMAPHPEGKTLYVTNGMSDDMTLVDVASGKAIRTVPVGRVPHSVLVQP